MLILCGCNSSAYNETECALHWVQRLLFEHEISHPKVTVYCEGAKGMHFKEI